ncbi:MAG: 50S ribosomal protein L4 [bacterium]
MAVTIQVYDFSGKKSESFPLEFDLTRKDVSPKTYSCVIKAFHQNQRQGTVGCKTRGELAFSNKKPWKQKGTGRARAGSLRSPLWRKGGVVFGPQPRVRTLSILKKQNKLVFNNILFSFLDNNLLCGLDFNSDIKPNTTKANVALKNMGFSEKKVTLFLSHHDDVNFASFRNIPYVSIVHFDQPNAFALSNSDCWVFLKKDMDFLKDMILQWN